MGKPIEVRAVRADQAGGVEVLTLGHTTVAEPGPTEVLVRVRAAGLNRADILQRRGLYPAPKGVDPHVLGLEYAGEVAKAGAQTNWTPGERVMGIVPGGAMAEQVIVSGREAMPIPANVNFEEAAAIPEAFLTAYDALFARASLVMGDVLLVHAAASGVGTAAIQLAKHSGARVLGTTRSESKVELVKSQGAEHVRVTGEADFAAFVDEHTGGAGANVILDLVGGSYVSENLRSLAVKGRWVLVGLLGGRAAELALGSVLRKRATLVGTVLRSRPAEEKAELAQAFISRALPAFATGDFRAVVGKTLAMEEIQEAHRMLEGNKTAGKIVLIW